MRAIGGAVPETRPQRVTWLAAGLLLGIGAWLRCHALGAQIVADDEMHSLRALRYFSARQIFSYFFDVDIAAPVALLQMGIARFVDLSEWTARLPVLGAGLGALLVFPALVRRVTDTRVALIFLGMLSISPQLVYYSRYGRPYMISCGLGFAAVLWFLRWWSGGGRTAAVGYGIGGALAAWFSPPCAPAVVTPLLFAFVAAILGPSRERIGSLRALAEPALALAASVTVLLAPPLWTTSATVFGKAGHGAPGFETLTGAARLFAGSGFGGFAAGFWGLAAIGACVGLRRWRRPTALLLSVAAVQMGALWLAAPRRVEVPAVYARYTLAALPCVLLLVSMALAALDRVSIAGRRWPLPALATAAMLALGLAVGPLPHVYSSPNNFMNHAEYQYRYDALPLLPREILPGFYCRVARDDAAYAIVEAPWDYHWQANRFHRYQRVHRKDVYVGFTHPPPPSDLNISLWPFGPPYAFDRFVDLDDPAGLAGKPVRYVVVHKQLHEEMPSRYLRPGNVALQVARLLWELREHWGAPIFEDPRIAAFRVDGVSEPPWPADTVGCP